MSQPTRAARRSTAAVLATCLAGGALVALAPATIASAAVVADDAVTVAADATGTTVVDVLANDADAATVTAVTQPAIGTVTIVAGGVQLAYPTTFSGEAAFSYTAADAAGGTATSTVVVTVTNGAPVLQADIGYTAVEPIAIPVLENDSDPNGDALTVTGVTVDAAQGTATIDPSTGVVTFTPATTFAGDATIAYTVTDPRGGTASSTITVPVLGPDPLLVYDFAQTLPGVPVVIDALGNDIDPLNRILSYDSVTTDEITYGTIEIDEGGTPDDASDDVLLFTPGEGFTGTLGFLYVAATPQGARFVGNGEVYVGYPAPTPQDDTASAVAGQPVTIDVLANDTDPSGLALSLTEVTVTPAEGSATIVDGRVVFTPAASFVGTAYVFYTVTNEEGASALGVVSVEVTAAPVVTPAPGGAASSGASGGVVRLPDTGSDASPALAALAALLLLGGAGAIMATRRRATI